MSCFSLSATERLATALARGLRRELFLTPKPGLVDLLDSGSHPDLTLSTMLVSIDQVGEYFHEVASALDRGAALPALVSLGRKAEERMLATLGTNTHKGAIFLGGLLLVARTRCGSDEPGELSSAVAETAAEFFSIAPAERSNGGRAREHYRVGGIVGETLEGLPSLFRSALPAYLLKVEEGGEEQASFAMLAALMRSVEDTTALHRCGPDGLKRLRHDGFQLKELLDRGENPVSLLQRLNDDYRSLNLTMGGVADLIGLAYGILDYRGLLAPTSRKGIAADVSIC